MKRFAHAILLSLTFLAASARAQSGPDDDYLIIFGEIQQADALAASGQSPQSMAAYIKVQGELQKFQKEYPDWNPNIVNFRLNYLSGKIGGAATSAPAGTAPASVAPVAETSAAVAPAVTPPAVTPPPVNLNAGQQAELADLRSRLEVLQSDNETLAAKLKEALAAQPASVDPRALAAAEEKVRSLMKQNDLLQVTLSQPKPPAETGVQTEDVKTLKQARKDLAAMGKKLSDQVRLTGKYMDDNQALQAQVKSLQTDSAGMQALRDENAILKKQLAEAVTTAKSSKSDNRVKSDLKKAQAQINELKVAAEANAKEKAALEDRIKQLEQAAAAGPDPAALAASEKRISELVQERDALRSQMVMAAKSKSDQKSGSDLAVRMEDLSREVETLQSRVAVDEAQPVPYTEEELALFRQTPPVPMDSGDKSAQALPGGTTELVASAHSHFAAGEYEKAAADYQQILNHDQNNGLALANLATIELQEGRLADAEKHIQAAVALSPNDAYNLSVLGNLKLQQGKFDEALDILGRAVRLDPMSPMIQNYLGVTLGQKGLRLQAETALRRALVIDPNFAPAHNNLAAVYISEQPPRAELARWHYLKALAAGQARNPGLEKLLSDNGAAIPAQ